MKRELLILKSEEAKCLISKKNYRYSSRTMFRFQMWSMQFGRLPIPYVGLTVQISIEMLSFRCLFLTRLEAALLPTKDEVVALYKSNPNTPEKVLENKSGYKYYNTSSFTLENLQNDPNAIEENFIAYLDGYSCRVKDIIENLKFKEQVRTLAQSGRLLQWLRNFLRLICRRSVDSMVMGYMFEDIIRRFSENEEAGSHYTPREVIASDGQSTLIEADEELFVDKKSWKS